MWVLRKLQNFFLALLDYSINIMARSDGDISARGMTIVYALRRPLLELANEFAEEATTYFMELLQDWQTSKDVNKCGAFAEKTSSLDTLEMFSHVIQVSLPCYTVDLM